MNILWREKKQGVLCTTICGEKEEKEEIYKVDYAENLWRNTKEIVDAGNFYEGN